MARRPVVVHLTTVDMSLELLLGPQLRAFRRAGYRVVGASAPGPYVAGLEADGIEHVALRHATRSWSPTADARALRELVGLFGHLRPDVVHTHNPKPGLYGRLAARLARVPVIVNTVHGLYAQRDDRWAKRAAVYGLERLAATCSHAELVQNAEDLETLRRLGVPDQRLHLLGNGIDLARFSPSTVSEPDRQAARAELGATGPGDVVIGCVARMVREKGIAELVEAAEVVQARHPRARFALVGPHDPSRHDDIPAEVVERARAAGIRLLGQRDDMVRLYAAMDVFALPSHREGFPRSVMEASAMGVPVVATDIRGCRQAVDHGSSGLLVPPRDPAPLVAALEALLGDPGRRAAMAAAARDLALRRFDVSHQVRLTLDVYERLGARAAVAAG
jgi:glycosyltransferase involved in cell wall biosynthesis